MRRTLESLIAQRRTCKGDDKHPATCKRCRRGARIAKAAAK